MSLLVLAYPELETKDFKHIQAIRQKHDVRYFNVVDPHFTLVFPVSGITPDKFISHVFSVSRRFSKFYFVLRCAQIVKDSFSDYTDVFLIPEEGYRIFVTLHDELYTGPLEKELRLDIPFIPHLGAGSSRDAQECKKIADKINSNGIEIFGAVGKLDIVSYTGDAVKTLEKIHLKEKF